MSEELHQEQAAEDKTSLNNEGSVPYSRFQEVNSKYKELSARLEKMEAEGKAKEDQRLIEENRWKEIAEKREKEIANLMGELEPLKGKQAFFDEWQQSTKAELLEVFDPEDREIYSNLDLDALKKLAKKVSKGTATTVTAPDKSMSGGKFGGYSSLMEFAQKDPKGYQEARKMGKVKVG